MFKSLVKVAAGLAISLIASLSTQNAVAEIHGATADTVVSLTKSGTFKGLSKHVTKGGVSIVKTQTGYIAFLENNFSLDGAPAPTLGFGKDGKFDPQTEFTKLQNIKGAQVYAIPAGINPENFNEFYVWCADFTVPLGVAKLK